MEVSNQEIMNQLQSIRTDVNFIKQQIIEPGIVLTPHEEMLVDKSIEEFRNGETISHEELKKELGL